MPATNGLRAAIAADPRSMATWITALFSGRMVAAASTRGSRIRSARWVSSGRRPRRRSRSIVKNPQQLHPKAVDDGVGKRKKRHLLGILDRPRVGEVGEAGVQKDAEQHGDASQGIEVAPTW
jgi:hypothetical protein